MYAAQTGNLYIVQHLVEEYSVDPLQTNAAGKTALDIARDNNCPKDKGFMRALCFFIDEEEQCFTHNDVIQFLEKIATAHQ